MLRRRMTVSARAVLITSGFLNPMRKVAYPKPDFSSLLTQDCLGSVYMAQRFFSGSAIRLDKPGCPVSKKTLEALDAPLDWQLPPHNDAYVERPQLSQKLEKALKHQAKTAHFIVLHGTSGAGKTQLMSHYAHSATQFSYRVWLTVDGPESTREQVYRFLLSQKLIVIKHKPNTERLQHIFKQWQANHPHHLLLLDNARDFKDLLPWLNLGIGHQSILVTTRDAAFGGGNRPRIAVDKMEAPEAIALLSRHSGRTFSSTDQQAGKLVKLLGRLPLAVTQAGLYLFQHNLSLKRFIQDFQTKQAQVMHLRAVLRDTKTLPEALHVPTWTIVEMDWELLKDNPLAQRMLIDVSLLNPHKIPREILGIKRGSKTQKDALKKLTGLGLLQPDGEDFYQIHPLIQGIISAREETQARRIERHRQLMNWVSNRLMNTDDIIKTPAQYLPLLPHGQRLIAMSNKEDLNLAQLLFWLGNSELIRGDAHGAKELFKRALTIQEQHYGKEHPRVAITQGNLGIALSTLGDARGQKELLQRALPILEQHYGKKHLQVAFTLVNLGNALGGLGDARGQKELLQRALPILEQHYGKEHPQVAITLDNLGNTLADLGDARGQKELIQRALKIQEQYYGKEHPQVAKTLVNLSNALSTLGDARGQKELLQRALPILEQHYGKEHPQVAITLGNLGTALGTLGDARGQKELLQRALTIQEQHYGKEHPQVAKTLVNLGNALGDLDDATGKKELLQRALTIQEQHYGKEHPQVAKTLVNLSNALGTLGDATDQKELLQRALPILEQHYGKKHPQVAMTLENLGIALGDLGDTIGKTELLQRALPILEQHYGKEHSQVAMTLENLGIALGDLGDATGKKELLQQALPILEQHYGKEHHQVASTLVNLGNALGDLDDATGQKELLQRALTIEEQHYGKEHPQVAMTLANLGAVEASLTHFENAEQLFTRAHHIFLAHQHPLHKTMEQTMQQIKQQKTQHESADCSGPTP